MKATQRLLAVFLTAALLLGLFGCAAPVAQDIHAGHSHTENDSLYTSLSAGQDENYDLTQPFDQTYPEQMAEAAYDTDTLLLKLPESMGGAVTAAMRDAGVSALTRLFALEDAVWFEAQLAADTDIHQAVTALREIEDILVVDYNYHAEVTGMADPEDIPEDLLTNPRAAEQWYLEYCGIPSGMGLLDNPGGTADVVVAVIDTGVDFDHEDLANNIWFNEYEIPGNGMDDDGNGYTDDYYGVNLISGRGNGDDDHGHGTHVAGIIAAENNDIGVVGLAYNVKIMPIKASSAAGVFNQADIARAVLYAYANGAHVINMSFGGTACSIAVQDALSVAYGDCVLVASAGNDGARNEGLNAIPNYPAALSYVLGVMSVDSTGVESGFTNWDVTAFNGVEYELYAPGENILSTIPNDGYASWSGTSMAAPVVAAMAALLRSQYPDTSLYSSRFIYGQLASTSNDLTTCLDGDRHGIHNLPPIVNLHSALTVLPTPDVNMSDYALFDTVGLKNDQGLNNGDGVIDAGEVIALGLTLRNHWGQSRDTIVKLDALSPTGIPDPYITILNDTVNYGAVGTYSEADCGRIYEDSILVAWENPFYIQIAEDCPNDYWFNLNVTVTCGNGMDDKDQNTYTNTASILLLVRNGVLVPQIIDEDMVWTGDKLYIIPDATIIEEGVTVTVEPGAQIQFWSADPDDPYADSRMANLVVKGTFLVEGTKDNPIAIAPAESMAQHRVHIYATDNGYISLKYADVVNLIQYDYGWDGVAANDGFINYVERCTFRMNYPLTEILVRGIGSDGRVAEAYNNHGMLGNFLQAKDCVFDRLGFYYSYTGLTIYGSFERCVFLDCALHGSYMYGNYFFAQDCLFLGNYLENGEGKAASGYLEAVGDKFLLDSGWSGRMWCVCQELGKTYFYNWYGFDVPGFPELLELINGQYLSVETQEEANILNAYMKYPGIDMLTPGMTDLPKVIEIEGDFSTDALRSKISEWYTSQYGMLQSCAILNRISTQTDPEAWMTLLALDDPERSLNISGNYWGTLDETIIGKHITDYYDAPASYAKLIYSPILTTPPETTFPFVTGVTLYNKDGQEVTSVSSEEITVRITFNRDMDTSLPLTVQYGPAYPYTDQTIEGRWVDARTWEGTKLVPTTIDGGQQYFRIAEGCSAADDLILGTDVARFTFAVEQSGAQAMVLQGESNQKGVKLSWMQDDFDTLMGYNIYRSTEEDGWYERVNQTVIPSGTTEFVDTTVEPGTTYYYNFTVVQTDLAESEPSDNLSLRHHQLVQRITKQPTCTEPGTATYTCMNCGARFEAEVEPLGHDYTRNVIQPTCTESGCTIFTCADCGDSYTEPFGEPFGHDFGAWYVSKEATEEEEGQEQRDCSRCDASETRPIPKLDHVHDYESVVTEPTCTEGGFTTYTCRCGDSYVSDETEPLGHDFGAWYVTKEATEEAEGQEQRDCSRCDASETRPIPKLDHVHDYESVVTEPTCTEGGFTTYTCRCGDSYVSDETEPLGHAFENGTCIRCGEKDPDYVPENPFTDVPESQWYFEPVLWAVENGITSGTSAATFSPDQTCTRAQVVTFLWRAFGKPEPTQTDNPFTDVAEGDYFYSAVLWAVENGITAGMNATTFGPNNPCTRAQVVTFLWRAMDEPMPENAENPFSDVTEGEWFFNPVLWAVENSITAGMSPTTFAPNNPCTRAQVVTFLWRTMKGRM